MEAPLRRLVAAAVAAIGTTDPRRVAEWIMANRAAELRQMLGGFARAMLGGGEDAAGRADRHAEPATAGDLF